MVSADQRDTENRVANLSGGSIMDFSDHPANLINVVTSGFFGSVGLCANGFLLCYLARGLASRKPHELIIAGICASDALFCLSNVCEAYTILNNEKIWCNVNGFFYYVFGSSSIVLPCLAMLNRYVSLYYPELLKRYFTKVTIFSICMLNLFFYIAMFVPFIVNDSLGFDDFGLCGVLLRTTFLKVWFQINEFYILFTYVISAFCAYRVWQKIHQHKTNVAENFQSQLIEESNEISQLMILLLCMPLVCQLPAVGVKVVQCFVLLNPWISRLVICVFPITSAFSPLVIMIKLKKYRTNVCQLLNKKSSKVTPSVRLIFVTNNLNNNNNLANP